MACQKKEKNFEKASLADDTLHTIYYYNSKRRPYFVLGSTMILEGKLGNPTWIWSEDFFFSDHFAFIY